MSPARLPALAIGNGRLLVTLDAYTNVLSSCWPYIDSPNQVAEFSVAPLDDSQRVHNIEPRFGYITGTNASFGRTQDGLEVKDVCIDITHHETTIDVHVRQVAGPHPALMIYIVPELDGRPGHQTIFWDENTQVLLAFCRGKWVAIGCNSDCVYDYHCGRLDGDSSGKEVWTRDVLPGERIAFRKVDAVLRVREATQSTNIFSVYGKTREEVLRCFRSVRNWTWDEIEQENHVRCQKIVCEITLRGWSEEVDQMLRRSALAIDVLTNRESGGTIAGPDAHSGIQSAPGYATVWSRDAAWTLLGALSLGCKSQAKKMLEFACATQSPEGLWLHRHHTDYTLAPSWGLHQIDETGILLYSFACYIQECDDVDFLDAKWLQLEKAANFLVDAVDDETGLPLKSVDLWEEREGIHLYTCASVIAGLRAVIYLVGRRNKPCPYTTTWQTASNKFLDRALSLFWKPKSGHFISSLNLTSALPMVDSERPELSAKVQDGLNRPQTALGQYPNWRDSQTLRESYRHDVSVLALAVPFGLLPLDDQRVVSTVSYLREKLWTKGTGGFQRYEGDSYGGGNSWPLATLWLAIYEGACGHDTEAKRLIEWVLAHATPAGLIPEQVHRETAQPVAAVPLSWSHAMVALAVATVQGKKIWQLECTRNAEETFEADIAK